VSKTTKVTFGNRRANILCNLKHAERIELIAEGLPVILRSAQSFWHAAQSLKDSPREAQVLIGFAEEEAAKILILIDLVRCPRQRAETLCGKIVATFYDHLSRLIYAEAQNWRPTDIRELQSYIDSSRQGHYLEGNMGEYIVPNWTKYRREATMYADIEVYEDENPQWNNPFLFGASKFSIFPPRVLEIAEATEAVGMFSLSGLKHTSEVWGSVEFIENENFFSDAQPLTKQLFDRLDARGLVTESATEKHAALLLHDWQMPMYNLDFKELPVSLDDLKAEQDDNLWREADY
jgi:hypothetical protein